MGANAPGVGSIEPAHNSISIHNVLRRNRIVLTGRRPRSLADVEGLEQRAILVREKLVTSPEAGLQPGIVLRRINAHGIDLHAHLLELAVVFLQLAELHYAEGSP